MWIELLRSWLDEQRQALAKQQMEERRARQDNHDLDWQSDGEFVPWHLPPFY